MTDRISMAVQKAYLLMVTVFLATNRGTRAVVVHASIDLGGENSELLQSLLKQLDFLINKEHDDKAITQEGSDLASTLLQATPSVTFKGNITDHQRRLTLTFTVKAARSFHSGAAELDEEEDDDEEWEDYDWRGSGGVFTPLVGAVEPYVLSFVELVFNGILSSVITNFLEGTNLLGDVRLV